MVKYLHDLPQELLRHHDVDEDIERPECVAFQRGRHDRRAARREGLAVAEGEGVRVHHAVLDGHRVGHGLLIGKESEAYPPSLSWTFRIDERGGSKVN